MKKIILFIFLLITIASIAQQRENDKIFKIVEKSPKLFFVNGWMKNDSSGKWVENKNVIAEKKVSSFTDISHYIQNFEWIQIAKIVKGNEKYYAVIYKNVSGKYDYVGYEYVSGWNPYYVINFAIITPSIYELFKVKIQAKEGQDFYFDSYVYGIASDNLIESINFYMNLKEKYPVKETFSFLFNSQTLDDEEIVRYRLGYDYNSSFRQQGIYDTDTDLNLDNSYFEVSKNEFLKLLID